MKVPILLPKVFNHTFTYETSLKLKLGDYVEVPFGNSKTVGVVWDDFEKNQFKKFKTKKVIKKLNLPNLNKKMVKFIPEKKIYGNYKDLRRRIPDLTSAKNILGDEETGGETIENILDIGRIAIASEMLGNAEAAFETTLDYLKQRKQFGVLIGSFQALQHRAAEMFCELELTKSSVIAAMKAADEGSNAVSYTHLTLPTNREV